MKKVSTIGLSTDQAFCYRLLCDLDRRAMNSLVWVFNQETCEVALRDWSDEMRARGTSEERADAAVASVKLFLESESVRKHKIVVEAGNGCQSSN